MPLMRCCSRLKPAPQQQRTWARPWVGQRRRAPGPCAASKQQEPDDQTVDRVAAALGAIGLSGSAAVGAAAIFGVDLWRQFYWDRLGDFEIAAVSVAPLVLLETLLFLPPYGRSLTPAPATPQQQQQQPGQQLGAGAPAAAAQPPFPWQALASGSEPTSGSLLPFMAVNQWCYVGSQVAQRGPALPTSLSLALIAGRELAKELMQRGLLLYGLAAFLSDRVLEQSSEQVASVALMGSLLSGSPGGGAAAAAAVLGAGESVRLACRYVAACVVTLALLPASQAEAEKTALWYASSVAALQVSSGSSQQAQAGAAAAGSGGEQAAPARSSPAGAGAAAAASGSGSSSSSGGGSKESSQAGSAAAEALLLEYRLVEAISAASSSWPAQTAYVISMLRSLLRLSAANAAFAATGNLAATLTLSFLSSALLALYVELGRQWLPSQQVVVEGRVQASAGKPRQ